MLAKCIFVCLRNGYLEMREKKNRTMKNFDEVVVLTFPPLTARVIVKY